MNDEPPPVYDHYEISGNRSRAAGTGRYVEPCADAEAESWTLYGHVAGRGEPIGDFPSREAAERVYYRITGQEFTGPHRAHDRLRLMHAAPLLLEALEPYALEAINLMEMANGEDNEDVVDHFASRLVHAYSEASPRPPGADAVTRQIERLLEAGYLDDFDDPGKVWPDFAGMNASHIPRMMLAWAGLDRSQQERMLEKYVDWSGFDHPSSGRVTQNVLAGRPKEEWFAGLDPRAPHPHGAHPARAGPVAGFHARLDRGEPGGEDPDPQSRGDLAGLALRLAELAARVEDLKHAGDADPDPGRYRRWGNMLEEVKLHSILDQVRELHLESEPAADALAARAVDVEQLPREARREFDDRRFDLDAANLRQRWHDDGLGFDGRRWEDRPALAKVAYLADLAAAYNVSFERFAAAARPLLGMAAGQEFTADHDWFVRREYHRVRPAEMEAFADAVLKDGFNWPGETPLERVERQIGHIKLRPDPQDFSIEDLGPWDTGVSEEWTRLPEAEKLSRLAEQVDWRDIAPEKKRRLLGREVDLARVPEERSADAGSPPAGGPGARDGRRRGEGTVVWDDDDLFRDLTAPPPPTRQGVEEQIRRLKVGTEFTMIVAHLDGPPENHFVEIRREEKLIGRSWGELSEGQKLGQLQVATDIMLLDPEETRELLTREVDFTRVPPAEQEAYLGRPFDDLGKADGPPLRRPEPGRYGRRGGRRGIPDEFELVAANLERQWYDEGLSEESGMTWDRTRDWYRLSYLADFAAALGVSFDRFAAAARDVLGLGPGQDFSPAQESDARREYERWRAHYGRDRAGPGAGPAPPDAEGPRPAAGPGAAHRARFRKSEPDKGQGPDR